MSEIPVKTMIYLSMNITPGKVIVCTNKMARRPTKK